MVAGGCCDLRRWFRLLAASYAASDRASRTPGRAAGLGFARGELPGRVRADRCARGRAGLCADDSGRRAVGGRAGVGAVVGGWLTRRYGLGLITGVGLAVAGAMFVLMTLWGRDSLDHTPATVVL